MSDRLRLLVVDDEPMIVDALRRLLSRDHDVHGCTSAEEVLDLLRAGERFDALVLDYHLADRTAVTLVDDIVRLAPDQAAHVVILSGDDRAAVEACGRTVPTLDKPVAIEDLVSVVEAVAAE